MGAIFSNAPQTISLWTFTVTSSWQDLGGRSWSNDPGFYWETKKETEHEKKLRIAFERTMAAIALVRLERAPVPLRERLWFRERRVGRAVESRYRVMLC